MLWPSGGIKSSALRTHQPFAFGSGHRHMPTTLSSLQSLAQLAAGMNFGFSAVATFSIRSPDEERKAIENVKLSVDRLVGDPTKLSDRQSTFLASQVMELDRLSGRLQRLSVYQDYFQGYIMTGLFFVLSVASFGTLLLCSVFP